jgi:hypothetical protein
MLTHSVNWMLCHHKMIPAMPEICPTVKGISICSSSPFCPHDRALVKFTTCPCCARGGKSTPTSSISLCLMSFYRRWFAQGSSSSFEVLAREGLARNADDSLPTRWPVIPKPSPRQTQTETRTFFFDYRFHRYARRSSSRIRGSKCVAKQSKVIKYIANYHNNVGASIGLHARAQLRNEANLSRTRSKIARRSEKGQILTETTTLNWDWTPYPSRSSDAQHRSKNPRRSSVSGCSTGNFR